jgi:hypothetical protein
MLVYDESSYFFGFAGLTQDCEVAEVAVGSADKVVVFVQRRDDIGFLTTIFAVVGDDNDLITLVLRRPIGGCDVLSDGTELVDRCGDAMRAITSARLRSLEVAASKRSLAF